MCVPILRSDDNCFYPKVGTPQSPNFLGNYESVVDVGSPDEPRYKVRAYAGPMSPQEVGRILQPVHIMIPRGQRYMHFHLLSVYILTKP